MEKKLLNVKMIKYILDAAEEQVSIFLILAEQVLVLPVAGKVLEGEVDNDDQTFLDDEQLEEGFALLCVTYPESDCLILSEQEENL